MAALVDLVALRAELRDSEAGAEKAFPASPAQVPVVQGDRLLPAPRAKTILAEPGHPVGLASAVDPVVVPAVVPAVVQTSNNIGPNT